MAKPLVTEAVDQDSLSYKGLPAGFYRAALPLSRQTLTCAAESSAVTAGGSGRAGKLTPECQAPLVLAYLRNGQTFADLVVGFGLSP